MIPPMQFIDLIRKKRYGSTLTGEEIQFFVDAVTHERVPDYQITALLMAIFLKGMNTEERSALTQSMVRSGDVLSLEHIPGPKIDKHSTGGVGDKVSLCLAPAVAACGVVVPMVSGRGLGHTGGTLDKLEAIPGMVTRLSTSRLLEVVERCGLVFAGQSADIAPADRKLYALRDVTATVENLSLITSSIMSKKLAEGLDGLVLDVKVGDGAFMKNETDARELANALVAVGSHCGLGVTALLTDMNQPLGLAIGNANEMTEAIEILQGGGPADLKEITVRIGGEMLLLGNLATTLEEAVEKLEKVIADGSALRRLQHVIENQDGDPGVCEDVSRFPQPAFTKEVVAQTNGIVNGFETERLGRIVVALGGGRLQATDDVDPAVGIRLGYKCGDAVSKGTVLATVSANDETRLEEAASAVNEAISVGPNRPAVPPLFIAAIRAAPMDRCQTD